MLERYGIWKGHKTFGGLFDLQSLWCYLCSVGFLKTSWSSDLWGLLCGESNLSYYRNSMDNLNLSHAVKTLPYKKLLECSGMCTRSMFENLLIENINVCIRNVEPFFHSPELQRHSSVGKLFEAALTVSICLATCYWLLSLLDKNWRIFVYILCPPVPVSNIYLSVARYLLPLDDLPILITVGPLKLNFIKHQAILLTPTLFKFPPLSSLSAALSTTSATSLLQ